MAVSFNHNRVSICCDVCAIEMLAFERQDLTLSEALDFADNYKERIFCRKCSEPPLVVPKNLEEFH